MKYVAQWSKEAIEDLGDLDVRSQDRITRKVEWFCHQEVPMVFAKLLQGSLTDYARFRIGDYRVIFRLEYGNVNILRILRVKHRREVYD